MYERGSQIGRFTVVTELGSGGMGAVYAAHDPQLDRQVALKVMRNATGDEEDRVRMMREGQAMARVTHPNVITVYEVGTAGGTVFLAQELLDGGTLRQWLEKPRPPHAIIDKFVSAGRGLAAAHAAGLVHRDFKPDNVLLGEDGRVRVADFGLAKAEAALGMALEATQRGGGPPRDSDSVTSSPMNQLTRTGAVMGTPMFMAPEQHRGERADARSDQFAFCVSLYHALYEAWPYDGKTAPALADAVIDGRLAPIPKSATVPARLRKILLRGLSTDPTQRYPTMEALLGDLEQDSKPRAKSRLPLYVATGLVVAAGGAGVYAVMSSQGQQARTELVAPTPSPEAAAITSETGIAWLSTAVDKGRLDDAIEKYELAAGLKASEPAQAAIAKAASAYVRVLRGDLKAADAKLKEAVPQAGDNLEAKAYIDLADAALAHARGQLQDAYDRSGRCAKQFETSAPTLAAICYQLHGEAQASLGDGAGARKAYAAGLAAAQGIPERTSTLRLALALLDLDELKTEDARKTATAVQSECDQRDAIGCEVQARIVLARIKLGESEAQRGVELLAGMKPSSIETFSVRIAHAIALGEINGVMNEVGEDDLTGLDRIEKARSEAEVKGFVGLMLEAKLARLRVLLTHDAPEGNETYAELVKQARAAKIERIARLADVALKEYAGPVRDMLPVDGGLPDVRSGSSGP